MSKSTLQHFISTKKTTQSKTITREKIKEGSDSSLFLKRINLPEDQKPCFKLIDMRGKAPGPYRKVDYEHKIMYLDDISFLIFAQGLKDNKGIFTMGSYQEILYGKHSYMGKESLKSDSEKTHGLNLLINDEKRESIQDESSHEYIEGRYSPTILPLGYNSKRQEQRLIYVMPISLNYKEKNYQVKTRDFSVNGLKVFLPRTLFIAREIVRLNFDFFIAQQSELTDSSASRFFKHILYRIVDVQHINDKTYLSLIQLDLNDYCKQIFSQFINSNKVQYKFDATDIVLTAKAKYVENLYTHNLTSIPLFLSEQDLSQQHGENSHQNSLQRKYSITNIIETSNNKKLLDFFLKPGITKTDYDFSPFMLSHRLLQFVELSFDNSSALLFVYWENNKLYSLFDFEFLNKSDLATLALKVMAHSGKVFCLNAKQIKKPEKQRLKAIINNLLSLERDLANNILYQTSLFVAQLMLSDITDAFHSKAYFSAFIETSPVPVGAIAAATITTPIWCENKKLKLSNYQQINEISYNPKNAPSKVTLDIQKSRFNTRYIYTSPLQLKLDHSIIKAETIDFSEQGIGIKLVNDQKIGIKSGVDILVSFPGFAEMVKNINFIDVHYKIARVITHKNSLELGLVLVKKEKNIQIAQFFTQLINRNKLKLDICINDKLEYTLGHLIAAYIATNINSLPLLISKDKQNGNYIKHIGLTEVACKLAEHFFLKLRGYNFKLLTSDLRLEHIHSRTLRGNSHKDQSFTLFIYKDINQRGVEFIYSFTSLEVVYQGELQELLGQLFAKNGACIKLNFLEKMEVDSSEMETIFNLILAVNKHHCSLLKRELADVIGLVDMVDVTLAYKRIFELQQTVTSNLSGGTVQGDYPRKKG